MISCPQKVAIVLLSVAMLANLFVPALAYGQDITHVEMGDAAPFTGKLFPEATAVKWKSRISLLTAELKINGDACTATAEVRREADLEVRKIQNDVIAHNQSVLETAALKAAERDWYEHPVVSALMFAAGVVVGSLTVSLATGAVN